MASGSYYVFGQHRFLPMRIGVALVRREVLSFDFAKSERNAPSSFFPSQRSASAVKGFLCFGRFEMLA